MTVTGKVNLLNYVGDGVTTEFDITFPYGSTDDLVITQRDTDYVERELTVGDGLDSITSTKVTTTDPVPDGGRLLIQRWTNPTQETEWEENDPFPAASNEDALDKLTYACQDAKNNLDRLYSLALRFPYFSANRNWLLPRTVVPEAFLRVNTAGDGVEFYELGALAFTLADVQALIDAAVQALATDVATALTEGVWHDATGWERESVNDSADADSMQLTSFMIPAGLMGPTDALEVISSWTMTGTDEDRSLIGAFGADADGVGGTNFLEITATTETHANVHTLISNRGTADSQYGYPADASNSAFNLNTGLTIVETTIDTTANQYFSFQCAWAGAVDTHTIKLERYVARLIRP